MAVLTASCIASAASAGTITANTSDAEIKTGGSLLLQTNWTIRVGEQNAPSAGCMVMAFQLPTLPAGSVFTAASFTDQLASFSGTPAFNVDMYGLSRVASEATILGTDYYAGTLDSGATLIQDNILTPSTPVRGTQAWPYLSFTTNTSANTALINFLNTMYANGANAGKYVFIRLSPDIASMPTGNNAYNITSANAGNSFEIPTITYTSEVVPEPASVGILAGSGLLLLACRKGR